MEGWLKSRAYLREYNYRINYSQRSAVFPYATLCYFMFLFVFQIIVIARERERAAQPCWGASAKERKRERARSWLELSRSHLKGEPIWAAKPAAAATLAEAEAAAVFLRCARHSKSVNVELTAREDAGERERRIEELVDESEKELGPCRCAVLQNLKESKYHNIGIPN